MTNIEKQLEKLNNICKKLKGYKNKWEEYKAEVDKQISERRERESRQWGWGQV